MRLVGAVLAAMASGCGFGPGLPGTRARFFTIDEIGRSVEGRPIEALVFAGAAPPVLVLGGIHGDEPTSSALVEVLARTLAEHPEALCGRQVILIPRANPDGLAADTRGNARGIDVNRNFDTANFRGRGAGGVSAQSEPETQALVEALARWEPSAIVSVHAPLACIDPDGGQGSWDLAREMARFSPLPVRDLPAHPGSMGSYVGLELGLKIVTYELDAKYVPHEHIEAYLQPHVAPLLAAIRHG